MTEQHRRSPMIHDDRYPHGIAQPLAWNCVEVEAGAREISTLLLRTTNAQHLLHEHVSPTGGDRVVQLDPGTARATYERLPIHFGPFEHAWGGFDVGADDGRDRLMGSPSTRRSR